MTAQTKTRNAWWIFNFFFFSLLLLKQENKIRQNLFPKRFILYLENEEVSNYKLNDGVVYRKNPKGNQRFYFATEMEVNIIRHIHEKIGHLDVIKCYDYKSVRHIYWLPNMKTEIEDYIRIEDYEDYKEIV